MLLLTSAVALRARADAWRPGCTIGPAKKPVDRQCVINIIIMPKYMLQSGRGTQLRDPASRSGSRGSRTLTYRLLEAACRR
jgi:hypothetical protein